MSTEEIFVIEDGTLRSCTSQESYIKVPEGVTRIAENAFDKLPAVRIVLPKSLREIEKRAFSRCGLLRVVIVLSSEAQLPCDTFVACNELDILAVPNKEQVAYGATGYGHTLNGVLYQFEEGNVWLTEKMARGTALIVYLGEEEEPQIPSDIDYVRKYAFAGCGFLSHIDMPEASGVPNGVFAYCSNLKSVTLPKSMQQIGEDAFRCCASLTSVELPDSVQFICKTAFCGCLSLASVKLNEGLTKIEEYGFSHCKSLAEVILPSTLTELARYAFSDCTSLVRVQLPSGLKQLPRDAFTRCPSISEINLPEGVEELAAEMFDCVLKSAERIVLPDGIRRIGERAFAEYEMTEIRLPSHLIAIRNGAFMGCKNLRRIVFGSDIAVHLGEYIFMGVPSGLEVVFPGDRATFEAMVRPYEKSEGSYDGGQNGGAPGLYSETYLVSPLEHELTKGFTLAVFCEKDGERFTLCGTGGRKFISSSTPYDE